MIKTWSKFNENTTDDFREKISQKLQEVRAVFAEFEDMNIISYGINSVGYERESWGQYTPGHTDHDRFIDRIVPTLRLGFLNDDERRVLKQLSKDKYKSVDKQFFISAHIKIPGEPNEFGSTLIGNEGIKLFEDILVANSRLIDMGYVVKLDMNAHHNAYKPAKLLIYFNI